MTLHKARRLPIHKGPAAWSSILGKRQPTAVLEADTTADFVVVGGGFAGLSAARRLSQLQPGSSIVVLEAGLLAEGAAGRNSGFMIDLPHDLTSEDYAGTGDDRALIELNRKAIEFARQAVEEYRISPDYFDPSGKINGAAGEMAHAHNVSYAKHLAVLGEESQMLDRSDMAALTGSSHYRSGLYTAGTVTLQPAGYIRGLGDGLSARLILHENSPVVSLSRQGGCWTVRTDRGSVSAGRVILTNNGHLESFGFERGRLMQLFLYASMTAELDDSALARLGGKPRWGITPSDPMGTTMRRIDIGQGGNRIITRTCATLRPGMVVSDADIRRAARVHRRKFDQRFPQLSGYPMEYCWAGHLCLSLNGVSVVREVEDDLFAGCVQNGLGTARGTLAGIASAELACGETSDVTRYFTMQAPPKKLPPQPFATIGANSWMRFREWRAADE